MIASLVERRLIAYGNFMRSPIAVQVGVNCTLGHMGSGGQAATAGDGGHLMRYFHNRRETADSIRARETHEALMSLRRPLWLKLVEVTWVDLPKGAEARSERVAADTMGVSRDEYRMMRAGLFGWLENELGIYPYEGPDSGACIAATNDA